MLMTALLTFGLAGCESESDIEAATLPERRGGCASGATQVCVGSGACAGGQVCESDQTWGECDCGQEDAESDADSDTDTDADADADADAEPTTLNLHEATIYDNPSNVADWPVTTHITRLEFGDAVHVEFSKSDGDDRWPDVTPPGWDGPLQYTMGLAEYIDGKWVASAAIQFWYGLYASGGNVAQDNQIAVNWYYDSRWGELSGRQPATGEIVGLFVVAGNLRGVDDGSQSPVLERSDVVLFPFPDVSGATYTFE